MRPSFALAIVAAVVAWGTTGCGAARPPASTGDALFAPRTLRLSARFVRLAYVENADGQRVFARADAIGSSQEPLGRAMGATLLGAGLLACAAGEGLYVVAREAAARLPTIDEALAPYRIGFAAALGDGRRLVSGGFFDGVSPRAAPFADGGDYFPGDPILRPTIARPPTREVMNLTIHF